MADVSLTRADVKAIKEILLQYRAEGTPNPLLPCDVDLDGDGIVDSFGLDENDEVVVVRGQRLEDTVYESEGDDVVPFPESDESYVDESAVTIGILEDGSS